MKKLRRSKRLRLPRGRYQLTKPINSEDDDESDLEHERFQAKSIARSNQNANQIATHLFEPMSTFPIEEKQHQPLQSSSEHSNIFLYSINSQPKVTTNSDDLTPLSITTTNTTPLTALTYSNTKQTELEIVKIDLTDLSGTDTLDSSPSNTEHEQSLSFDREISLPNINYPMKDSTRIDDTDTSMKSVIFAKDHSLEQELSYQKHASCFIIPRVENGDHLTTASSSSLFKGISSPVMNNTNGNIDHQSSIRWYWKNMAGRFKFLFGCSALGFIAGIVILVIML